MSIKPIDKSEDFWEPIMKSGEPPRYTGEVLNSYTGERMFMPGLGEAHLLCKVLNERDALRDHSLELYGTLLCIGEWLRGDLPEANAEQFAAMIDAATGEPRADAPDAE
jgi:hypothetical protein